MVAQRIRPAKIGSCCKNPWCCGSRWLALKRIIGKCAESIIVSSQQISKDLKYTCVMLSFAMTLFFIAHSLPLHPFHRLPILMYKGWQRFFDQSNNTRFCLIGYEGRIVLGYLLGPSNRNHRHHPDKRFVSNMHHEMITIIHLTGIRGLSIINLPSTSTMM